MLNRCTFCNGNFVPVKTRLRQRIGCPSNCSGIMLEKIVGHRCTKCGNYFQSILDKIH